MRTTRHAVFATSTLFVTLAYVACIGPGSGGTSGPGIDASRDDGIDSAAPNGDVSMQDCNPCYEQCPCTPGTTSSLVLGSCMIYTCPASGMWGDFQCVGLGCPEASDEEDDAASDAPLGDGAVDARETAADAAADAPSDVATDRLEE